MSLRTEQLCPYPLKDRDLSASGIWEKDLEIRDGERVLVRASSGSGKTTFLGILYGIRKDHRGTVRWDGKTIHSLSRRELSRLRREEMGMVFQDLKLFEELSVRENIMLKDRLTEHFGEERVLNMTERLCIEDQWEKPVYKLSTGQKQRVAIIRALCQPLRFLLLDEPFSHLDPENVGKATELIEEVVKAEGAGLLLASLEDPYGLHYDRTFDL